MTFIVTILLARGLGAEGYGRYAFIFAIVSLASLPTQFGLPDLVVRETARAVAEKTFGLTTSLWSWAHIFIAVSSSVIAVGVLFVALVLGTGWVSEFQALAVAVILIPLISFSNLRAAALRGLGHDLQGQFPEHAIRPTVFAVGLVAVLWLSPASLSVTGAFAIQVAAAALATLFGVVLFWRFAPRADPVSPSPKKKREWTRALIFMGSISGLMLVNSSVDILMLGTWDTDSEVGRYRLASMVGALITLGLQTMNIFAMPYLSRHFHNEEWDDLSRVVHQTTQISFGFSLIAFVAILVAGKPMLGWVFGAEFSAAFSILVLLAIGHIANAFFGPAGAILTMQGAERLAAGIMAMGTLVNVVLNALLIPNYAGEGAAIASSVSIIAAKAAMFLIVWRRNKILSWPISGSISKGRKL